MSGRSSLRAKLISSPYVVWSALFIVAPLIFVVYYSFTNPSGDFTIDNISALSKYAPTFLRSIWFGIVATVICLLIAFPLAYIISQKTEKVQRTLVMLVMLPMWMSFLIRTYSWMALLQDTGIINSFLAKLGIDPIHMINTSGAVILGMVYNFLPYMIMPIYSVMAKLDYSMVEAAQDLGCRPAQAFFKVVLPSIMPGIITGMIMAFTLSLDDFIISYFTCGPGFQTLPIAIFAMTKKRVKPDMYALSALIFVSILVLLILYNFAQQKSDEKTKSKK